MATRRLGWRPPTRRPTTRYGEGVLAVEPHVVQEGQGAQHRPRGAFLEHPQARLEQGQIPAKLVDDPAPDVCLVRLVEQGQGAVHRRQDPAAVDVTDDDDRQVHGPGQAHVDVVALAQVDLCGATRAFGDDDVEPGREVPERVERRLRQHLSSRSPTRRPPGRPMACP